VANECPKCKTGNPDTVKFCGECGTRLGRSENISITKTLRTPKPPKKIAGKYKILSELGRGGMGVVYKAKDTRLDRLVALKFLPPELTKDEGAKKRFIQEAKAAAALNHPHICTIYEVDEADDQTFIAMEFIEGQNLKDKLKSGPLDIDEAQDIIIQIAEGLKEAHEKGIVHRDIKPANIMLTEKGQAKITDFGLAKLSWGADLTKTSTTMGTAAYMSPEQAKGEEVDNRTDIWSLGVVFYEMLTGCLPFGGGHESAILHSIIYEEPQDLKKLCPGCPNVLADVIANCLQKDIEKRFASVTEILDILEDKAHPKKVREPQRKHNLPEQLTSFVGRSQEIETVQKLLCENRLVTLTGAGGCGKTRLAVETARSFIEDYEDGVWFINLGPVTDPNLAANEVMDVLDIKEIPSKAIIDTLIENVKNMSLLLLLDNCEHLVQACAEIADKLLKSVKDMRILATSREALNTRGEVAWRVPSLSFPDKDPSKDTDKALQYEAVKLFTERAVSSKPGFAFNPKNAIPIVGICQRVAGIPLAVELAATRIRHLSPETILERLDDQMKILASSSRTAPERQQTLKATIDWSYDLLSEEEQQLFNRLSVFTGDFSLEAVEDVCSDDRLHKDNILSLLSQLVDKSLVLAEDKEDESVHYRCLMPLHQYSLHKLDESGEEEKFRHRHLSFYLKLAEMAYEEQFDSELKWLNKLESEHDNLIAALNWTYIHSIEEFILLSGYLAWFWRSHSHIRLAEDFLEKALHKDVKKSEGYARALCGLGVLQWYAESGDLEKRKKLMNESLGIWRQLNNPKEEAIVLSSLSAMLPGAGEFEAGLKGSTKSLEMARKVGSPGFINHCLLCVCQAYVHSKKFVQGRPLVEELLASSEKLKHIYGIECARHFLADCALDAEDFKEAEKKYALAIETNLKYGFTWLGAIDLQGVAFALSGQSRWAKSIRLDTAAREKVKSIGGKIDGIAQFWDEWIETYLEGARKQVGEELTRKYGEEGKNMGFEAAVEYALDFDKD
jgi:predicted ATPase/predicted Ser/Thr protein kinase